MDFREFWDSCVQNRTSEISKKKTFRNYGTTVCRTKRRTSQKYAFKKSGTPVRRTRRRKSQKMHFQEFQDSCAQNKTSEIWKNACLGLMGLLCAEQNVRNLKNSLSGTPGLLCAEENVGILKQWTFSNSGTPVRRTKRQKSQKMDVQELWDSCAQTNASEI